MNSFTLHNMIFYEVTPFNRTLYAFILWNIVEYSILFRNSFWYIQKLWVHLNLTGSGIGRQ